MLSFGGTTSLLDLIPVILHPFGSGLKERGPGRNDSHGASTGHRNEPGCHAKIP